MGKECGMHGSEGNLEQICDGKIGRKGPFRRACEYRRKTLKWMVRKYIRVDFDYSCFGRALNVILIKLHNEP